MDEAQPFFHCESCNKTVVACKKQEHLTSMAHILSRDDLKNQKRISNPSNISNPPPSSSLSTSSSKSRIPPSNKGYVMLKKQGWDGKSGLGKDESGRKEPVAVLVRDNKKRGLGKGNPGRPLDQISTVHSSSKSIAESVIAKPSESSTRKARDEKNQREAKWRQSFMRYLSQP